MATKAGVSTKYMHRAKLSKFCGGRLHQNVILKTGRLDYENIRGMKDIVLSGEDENQRPEGKFYLFLDQVTDP